MRIYRQLLPYSVAMGSTALALLLSLRFEEIVTRMIGAFFYIAIATSTWYGGMPAGIVASVLSVLALDYYLMPPLHQLGVAGTEDMLRLILFVSVALIINFLSTDLQKSRQKIEQLTRQLIDENTEQLKTALNAAQMGLWDWDMVTGEIRWSLEHEQLFGLLPGSFDGKYATFNACLHPEDREGLQQAIAHSLQAQCPYLHEYRVVWADGSIHWVEGRGQVFYRDGRPVRMSGTIMAVDERKQTQLLLQQQFEQQRLVMEITQRIRQSLNLPEILQTTVDEVRQFLGVDRVIIFQFSPDWGGIVTVESVVDQSLAILPFDIHDPCIGNTYVEPFQQGLITAKADIYTAEISPCHVEFLAQFQIRANLVVPILKNGKLWGLIAAHHCRAPRQWQDSEIDLLRQVASQASIALQQAALFEQVQAELKERQQAEAALQALNAELEYRVTERTAELTATNNRLLVALKQQVQTQAALRDSEERRRLALDLTHIGFWDWHFPSGKIVWNDNHFTLLGLELGSFEPSYELWRQHVHPEDRDWVEQRFLNSIEKQIDYAAEYRVVYPDGSVHWMMARAQGIHDEAGQPLRSIGVLLDISDRKQVEEALRQSDEKFRQLAENIEAVFWMRDVQKQQVIYVSPAYETIWQKPCENLYYNFSDWLDAIHPDDRLPVETAALSLTTNGYYDQEYRILRPDHSIRWIRDRAVSIYNEAGEMVRVAGLAEDITDRKQVEQTLALQAVITRNMAEGICLVKVNDGTFVYANPKFEQMFGYNAGELIGQHVSIVNYAATPATAEAINQSIRTTVLQQVEATYEVHNVKKDGTSFWCSATCSVFQHPEYGDVLVAVHQDITDRKLTEVALQQQTRQKQLLWSITQTIRQSLDLTAILNASVTEMHQLLETDRVAVYRFNPDWSGDFIVEAVADNWIKLVEPNVRRVWEDTYLQETQGGRFQNHETLTVADIYTAGLQPCHIKLLEQFQARAYAIAPIFVGEILWGLFAIYQNAAPRHWEAWEIELLQQISSQLAIAIQQAELYNQLQIELQERKQAAAVLREAERRWRSLLDNVQLIVVGLDRLCNINYANHFFLNLAGYTSAEILGKNWCENFLSATNQATVQAVFDEVLTYNAHPYHQNAILTKSGEERFIAWNNTMLRDSNGTVIGMISIGEDITERQKVEVIKNEFIGIISHELRTPLTAIQMSLGLLKTGVYAKKPEKFQRMIEIALTDTNRLVNLVNDILDLERLESGRAVLEKSICQASDLMQQAIDGMQALAAQQHITLTLTPTDAKVWAAADTIIQTLTNLLSNAIKFSPAHSIIELSAEYQADQVLFQVSDQGRGIPADKLETVFGRFQQVDASDSREKGGTGLGLSICRSIIERHGGKIWAESTLGEGSTFFFTLPIPLENHL